MNHYRSVLTLIKRGRIHFRGYVGVNGTSWRDSWMFEDSNYIILCGGKNCGGKKGSSWRVTWIHRNKRISESDCSMCRFIIYLRRGGECLKVFRTNKALVKIINIISSKPTGTNLVQSDLGFRTYPMV